MIGWPTLWLDDMVVSSCYGGWTTWYLVVMVVVSVDGRPCVMEEEMVDGRGSG